MTSGLSRLVVVGVDGTGAEVARLILGHGDDPGTLLAVHGWNLQRVREVRRHPVERHVLTMTFVVEQACARQETYAPPTVPPQTGPARARAGDHRGEQVNLADRATAGGAGTAGETALFHQRVAAYAVVTSPRGLLMTQFSDLTGAPGQWGLPGGGLDAEEVPDRAVVREVWEESGQVVRVDGLALVGTSHWVGRAPGGQLEDYHAVRIIYRAVCPEPTDPVVHDVGGTTASAAWFTPAELDVLALTPGWRSILQDVVRLGASGAEVSGVVMAPDQTDGPDHHHHDTDADDGAGPQP